MKQVKFVFSTLVLFFFLLNFDQVQAQLHVDSDGEVGIGTTAPSARLDVYSSNATTRYGIENRNYYTGTSYKYGIYNYANSSGTSGRYGLYNLTYGPSGNTSAHRGIYNYGTTYTSTTAYGTYNYLYSYGGNGVRYALYNYLGCSSGDGTGTRYGLYSGISTACDGGTAWAGYFSGNVYVSGTVTQTSDARMKQNVTSLNGALGIVAQLKPKTYDYVVDEDLSLPTEKQYGFLAQDLEQVLPELVKDVETLGAPTLKEGGEEGEMNDPEVTGTIKSVNYTALIPILVQAIQEQQAEIEELKAELAKK